MISPVDSHSRARSKGRRHAPGIREWVAKPKAEKPAARRAPVEVHLLKPGQKPGGFRDSAEPIAFLDPDAPLPAPGDTIFLPHSKGEAEGKSRLLRCDTLSRFRVVERTHLYVPRWNQNCGATDMKSPRYLTTWLFVRPTAEEH